MATTYWKCIYNGSTNVAVRDDPSVSNGSLLTRNPYGRIIACDGGAFQSWSGNSNGNYWLHMTHYWNGSSWVSLNGYTAITNYNYYSEDYYQPTSNPSSTDPNAPSVSWYWSGLGSGSSSTSVSFNLGSYAVGYYTFTAPSNGTLTVYTSSSYDTYGYIGLAANIGWNNQQASNAPNVISGYSTRDDDSGSGSNFQISSFSVTSGSRYEIDVLHYSGSSMSGTLYITFTGSGWAWTSLGSGSSASLNLSFSLGEKRAGYYLYTPSTDGILTVYTEGSYDTYGYLGTEGSLALNSNASGASSVITGYSARDDDSGTDNNFKISSFQVNGSTTYRIAALQYSGAAMSGTLYIRFYPYRYIAMYDSATNSAISSSTFTRVNATGSSSWIQRITAIYKSNYKSKYWLFRVPTDGSTTLRLPTAADIGISRPGYTLGGWRPSGKNNYLSPGTAYNSNSIIQTGTNGTTGDSECILYPYWVSSNYTITYYSDGNVFTTSSHTAGTVATLTSSIPIKTGYTFKGWSKSNSAKLPSYYSKRSSGDISSATSLYAVWWPNFDWINYNYSEWQTFVTNCNNYFSTSLTSPNVYFKASDVNVLRTAFSLSSIATNTLITKTPLDELEAEWDKINGGY